MGMNPDQGRRCMVGRVDGRGCMGVQVRGRVSVDEGGHTFRGEGGGVLEEVLDRL
jgi:hypothetical protein